MSDVVTVTLPDGTRVLLVHAAPGTDDGLGLNNSLSDDEVREALAGCEADLICVGHFHLTMDRHVDGWHIINGEVTRPGQRFFRVPTYDHLVDTPTEVAALMAANPFPDESARAPGTAAYRSPEAEGFRRFLLSGAGRAISRRQLLVPRSTAP